MAIMGIVVSMVLITAGAVMRFAVSAQAQGFNVHTTGMVLMVMGVIGALLSIGFWASWGGFGGMGRRSTATGVSATVVSSQPRAVTSTAVTPPRTVVRETEIL
jgi:hypothetical protein